MKKGTPNWQLWQTVFLVPLVVINLNHGPAVDAAHAQASALFRLVVSLVCLVGIAWVFFQRRRMAKSAALDEQINAVGRGPEPDANDSLALNVTYRSTRETSWRCESYVATHQPASLCILGLFGLVVAFLLDDLIHQAYPAAGHFAFPFLWVAGSAAWLGFFWLLLQGMLQQRFPTPDSVRACTTKLTPEGVIDVTPDKVTALPWGRIQSVREHEGDILVWTAMGTGCYVPRTAFTSPEEGRRFFEAAVSLWRSRGTTWEQVAPTWEQVAPSGRQSSADEGVWPPAPSGPRW